ncbi:histidinol-phosphatase [Buchnera aphidicola str. Bp (Baizongia pistaciae)]|uniref:Histidine biosynthesis bifunctional protein HisB n=1 Tax=Buchnera aphidicola subsp. Baizongia pistaciae (strain Bp) TaxID=224915 RepID=HIS7_BUCBP|nr:bifunctional histidinol-phosphatase/imidazoleglycerol-phosphate dehydratase HisB [Buchnera aphidicola]P59454.1 RecName: Full=Histidine biosynthesis bifunctional protein HisB; Includes: RecName: Full=Histidinol-phosphatase; Includes: RecName: Full=Imidazoleglycerol-phosphate dehydratase; Short=IGPD [Buchnera aphidicola str. Bp (Baizongia pistaciae)]AAO26831.1 histidinol-phosphatase [Buchnera aphidicola str. Bp (Baizongia pistaciae)]
MSEKVLFIDRDGTLISEPLDNFQVDSFDKLEFKQDVISSLITLKKFNYKFVMVTNQDGLGSKNFPYKSFIRPHEFMIDVFLSQGIKFEEVLICPHELKSGCQCRKPNLGMVQHWLLNDMLDKQHSCVIGDRKTDMILANNMGILGIRYGTKQGNSWSDIVFKLTKKHDRHAKVVRNTKETNVSIEVWLDKQGGSLINTGLNMFNHMLDQIAVHSCIRMKIISSGDICVDDHHTVEDVGIVLGKAILKALGNKLGINRFGFALPMDDSSSYCLLDISGRPFLKFRSYFKHQYIGDMSSEMVRHFFQSLAFAMKCTLHLRSMGINDHHRLESLFKVFGKTLKQAIVVSGKNLPSSKGLL